MQFSPSSPFDWRVSRTALRYLFTESSVAAEVTSVNRRFSSCAILTFLWSSTCFAQDAPAGESSRPKLSISVHNYAEVPAELLLAAEEEAHKIFEQAGPSAGALCHTCPEGHAKR